MICKSLKARARTCYGRLSIPFKFRTKRTEIKKPPIWRAVRGRRRPSHTIRCVQIEILFPCVLLRHLNGSPRPVRARASSYVDYALLAVIRDIIHRQLELLNLFIFDAHLFVV